MRKVENKEVWIDEKGNYYLVDKEGGQGASNKNADTKDQIFYPAWIRYSKSILLVFLFIAVAVWFYDNLVIVALCILAIVILFAIITIQRTVERIKVGDKITYEAGILRKKRISVSPNAEMILSPYQSALGRILNYGDLEITTRGDKAEIHLIKFGDFKELYNEIQNSI